MLQTEHTRGAAPREGLQISGAKDPECSWSVEGTPGGGQVLRQGCRRIPPAHHPPPHWTASPIALGQARSEKSTCSKGTDKRCSFVRLLSN